jgi:magnesium-transporting ATPase (P-type)
MKARTSIVSRLGWLLALAVILIPAGQALGQDDDFPSRALGGAMLMVCLIVGLAFYVYFALALQTIANKTHTENAWLAWIPIANAFLMLNVAKKPLWWFILLLIPLVNLVIGIIIWMAVAEARGKPSWWGILILVPLVNLIVPGYLAWSD